MSQSQSVIAHCPECNNEWIYRGNAKKPRVTCKKCKTRFYTKLTKLTNGEEKKSKTEKKIIDKFNSLDETTIEKLILDLLNEEPTESRIKLAVEFHNKVKGSEVMMMEEPLDMEGFLKYELSQRETEGNPSVHKTT